MEEEIEDLVEEEITARVQELRKAMDTGNYKRANEILELFLYCRSKKDVSDVMIS